MIYKIMNYIFGWDYIVWNYCGGKGVSRIRVLPNGNIYYLRHGAYDSFQEINKESDVKAWLTCDKSKYLPTENNTI